MKEDSKTFKEFVNQMVIKSKDFLEFTKLFYPEYKYVKLEFYELDSDEYRYPVFKWSVDFSPSDKNVIVFRGYFKDEKYKLYNNETNEIELDGDSYEVNDYINQERFNHLSQEDIDRVYNAVGYEFDKCREWIKEVDGFKLVFLPDDRYQLV